LRNILDSLKSTHEARNEFNAAPKRITGEYNIKHCFSAKRAHEAQLRMSEKIIFEDRLPEKICSVAGVDVAYTDGMSVGAVAVLDYDSLKLIEEQTALCKTRFPYIPTLLSFRETEPAVLCIRKLHTQPDLFLVNAHGFAHPYRCGFASHLGLILRKPVIGVAKSKLIGEVETTTFKAGVNLIEYDRRTVGAVVVTKRGCKPVYVSVGHMISLETAIRIVKHCAENNRMPEPILMAHSIATAEKRKVNILSATKTRDGE